MGHINAVWKITVFFILLFIMLLIGATLKVSFAKPLRRRKILASITSWLSRFTLRAANVKVKYQGFTNYYSPNQNYLVVANHMGMLDILAILAKIPSVFVTSYELKETPIVGWLTDAAGCVFVERRNRQNIQNEVQEITQALKYGLTVTFFPEATSTPGDSILPFKKSLFVSAVGTGVPILPITINYKKINGRAVDASNRDYICWYGNQSFLPALWRLMSRFSIEIELVCHSHLFIHSIDDRRYAAEESHKRIASAFLPTTTKHG
ncbi:MAG: 1-acyl-sn-glycerol-3-phosphate acyltransferase [Bdellovibrionaceae bacterium]|nr:1-acyl-sn-glycerol-3-phosphate acyltransferase [Pseudobdellovibrionaceae bacterium]MDW8189377.1 lysophospholipid acyltransferase family protein [Pseudobdellovibrionaceae bacterium]